VRPHQAVALTAALFAANLVAIACRDRAREPPRPHAALDDRAEPFRTAFNAHASDVRVVALVSPT
jgi:hypothetical protein